MCISVWAKCGSRNSADFAATRRRLRFLVTDVSSSSSSTLRQKLRNAGLWKTGRGVAEIWNFYTVRYWNLFLPISSIHQHKLHASTCVAARAAPHRNATQRSATHAVWTSLASQILRCCCGCQKLSLSPFYISLCFLCSVDIFIA